jgi:hypothetical protein
MDVSPHNYSGEIPMEATLEKAVEDTTPSMAKETPLQAPPEEP